jgi:hypothetical protein
MHIERMRHLRALRAQPSWQLLLSGRRVQANSPGAIMVGNEQNLWSDQHNNMSIHVCEPERHKNDAVGSKERVL